MATHAQPINVGADDGDGSTSRLKMYLGVATTLITAVPATILAWNAIHPGSAALPPTPATQTVIAGSPAGEIDDVSVGDSDVYVTGSARADIDSVIVMIPGRKEGGNYWFNTAEVHDQKWDVVVPVDQDLPHQFKTIVRYRDDRSSVSGLAFRDDPTTPSTPPGVDPNCVVLKGDACFGGSDWGQASVSEVQQ